LRFDGGPRGPLVQGGGARARRDGLVEIALGGVAGLEGRRRPSRSAAVEFRCPDAG